MYYLCAIAALVFFLWVGAWKDVPTYDHPLEISWKIQELQPEEQQYALVYLVTSQ